MARLIGAFLNTFRSEGAKIIFSYFKFVLIQLKVFPYCLANDRSFQRALTYQIPDGFSVSSIRQNWRRRDLLPVLWIINKLSNNKVISPYTIICYSNLKTDMFRFYEIIITRFHATETHNYVQHKYMIPFLYISEKWNV